MSKFGGNTPPRVVIPRFSVQNGKFVRYINQNENETLDWINGRLLGIKIREHQKDNLTTLYADFYMTLDDGQKFIISTIASSSITADIVGRLANLKNITNVVVLSAWMNDKYTNIAMREKASFDDNVQGEKVPFTKMPAVKIVQNGFSRSMDSTERDNFVMKLISEITDKLKAAGVELEPSTNVTSPTEEPAKDSSGASDTAADANDIPSSEAVQQEPPMEHYEGPAYNPEVF